MKTYGLFTRYFSTRLASSLELTPLGSGLYDIVEEASMALTTVQTPIPSASAICR